MYIAFYINLATNEKYHHTIVAADNINEATKIAEKWVKNGYILQKVVQKRWAA